MLKSIYQNLKAHLEFTNKRVVTIHRVCEDPDTRGYYNIHYRFKDGNDIVCGYTALQANNADDAKHRFASFKEFDKYDCVG